MAYIEEFDGTCSFSVVHQGPGFWGRQSCSSGTPVTMCHGAGTADSGGKQLKYWPAAFNTGSTATSTRELAACSIATCLVRFIIIISYATCTYRRS